MSFASLSSDITDIVDLCKSLLRKCRDAGREYDETSDEVKGLHTVLRHLTYEIEDPESLVNIDRIKWGGQLDPIICDCDSTLRKLEDLLQKYGRHDLGDKGTKSSRRHPTEFSRSEMDQLGTIRLHLISRRKSLTQFLNTLQLHQSADPASMPNGEEQLDVILDKVDAIAARMARRSDVGNSSDDYEKFRRELVAEGFSNVVLQQHKVRTRLISQHIR
ncbi:hypothetical protein B0J14DRAFT_263515 [Halenospora varia]|nr:hypothetical protein B0J14DRAFT_263515 [Halenospora varia]